jgi:hypothetical protein
MFIGTPKGSNHFKSLRDFAADDSNPTWALKEYKASQTGLIAEDELNDAKKAMGDNKYEQEFEISFDAPIVGSYYGEIIKDLDSRNHIRDIESEEMTQKYTGWDLGMSDSTSIWVAESVGGEIRIMDYYENNGQSLDHYVGWLKDNGYEGYTHILPHDVMVRELGTGKSRYELLQEADLNIDVAKKIPVDDGIQAVRATLPSIWFKNTTTVNKGLECLRNYRRDFNEKMNVYSNKPLHDWSSHAADAFRYLCVGLDTKSSGQRTDWNKPIDDSYKNQYM